MGRISLKELRKKVAVAEQKEKEKLEKENLKRRLYELKNPRKTAFFNTIRKGAIKASEGMQRAGKRIAKAPKRRRGRRNDFDNPLDMGFGF